MLNKGSIFKDKNGMVAEVVGYRDDRFNDAGYDYQTKYIGSTADYWVDPDFVKEILYEAPPEFPKGIEFSGGNLYRIGKIGVAHEGEDKWTLHIFTGDDYVDVQPGDLRKLADTIDIVSRT